MKSLAIDEGNTSTKLALFDDGNLTLKINNVSYEKCLELLVETERMIISTVKKDSKYRSLVNQKTTLLLNSTTSIPIFNKYKSPKTLGNDRLALAVGAFHTFPNKNVLVIDAGTCITFDFINAQKEYLGGSISPGINMRLKALHQQTNQLPYTEPTALTALIGTNTEESIRFGVINGVRSEIDGIINRYIEDYSNIKVLVTGGDASFFDKALKNTIFAAPNLLMIGLNNILQHNESNI